MNLGPVTHERNLLNYYREKIREALGKKGLRIYKEETKARGGGTGRGPGAGGAGRGGRG
jgi:hypothetical protein